MKFPYGKFGPLVDPVGEYVSMDYGGRKLLGEVTGIYLRDIPRNIMAKVRHFNGEAWPIEPVLTALTWIKQEGREGE